MTNLSIKDSYNDTIVDLAWDENTPEHVKAPYNYVASKVESEKESFDWMDENKPAFVFNSVLPSFSVRRLSPWYAMMGEITDWQHRRAPFCIQNSSAQPWGELGTC